MIKFIVYLFVSISLLFLVLAVKECEWIHIKQGLVKIFIIDDEDENKPTSVRGKRETIYE
jgi:hypothetical protein